MTGLPFFYILHLLLYYFILLVVGAGFFEPAPTFKGLLGESFVKLNIYQILTETFPKRPLNT